MANKAGHRRVGNVRQRGSGRWQARYRGPDGLVRAAPFTFEGKRSAERWLTLMEGQIITGEWRAPESVEIRLREYAVTWVAERKPEPRSRELYELLLRSIFCPSWVRALNEITSQAIRTWRSELIGSGRSESTAAKSYRLLRAVLNTAVGEDRLIQENPCRIRGYDKEPTSERPTGSVVEVYRLAEQMPTRYRMLVLFAAFTGLRWGELTALRRCDLDMTVGTVRVWRKFAELQSGERVAGPPKSASGRRTVALPPVLVEEVQRHLEMFVGAEPEALVFCGPKGCRPPAEQFSSICRLVRGDQRSGTAGQLPLP